MTLSINRSVLQSVLPALQNHLYSIIKMKDKSFKMTELIWKFPAAIPPTLFRTYVGFFNLLISCSHEPSQN